MTRSFSILGALAACLALVGLVASAQEVNPVLRRPANDVAEGRLLVKFRDAGATGRAQVQTATDKVAALATRTGIRFRGSRALGPRWSAVELDPTVSTPEQLVRILADATVEDATLDQRRYPHAVPNDPLYAGSTGQWYLQTNAVNAAAINAAQAWDTTTGTDSVVIAVLDTGIRYDHPDLGSIAQGGRLLAGYDFVSDSRMAGDGDGRDADPTDPGDFLTSAEKSANATFFADCDVGNSSWHGTRTAGIIGARTNNAQGIAGATWSPSILPVRVLGKCGGFDSDIIAAMLWAAGIHVDGVPDNAFPAQIENLSLGGTGTCSPAYRDAVAAVAARGAIVVVSAGNEGGPVDVPANCPGAVGVAGLRHIGTKVGFSSLGSEVALSAPGGNCVNGSGPCLFPINTTTNLGTTAPGANSYSDQLSPSLGTSFSAPIVSGIAGLMLSVNSHLGAAQLRARLREGAVAPFPISSDPTIPMCHVPTGANDLQPSECSCTTDTCGAGMANAPGAVLAALRPIAVIVPPTTVSPGQSVTLPAGTSTAATGHTIASYAWTGSIVVTPPDQATGMAFAPSSGSAQVCVTVTDDAGRQDTAAVLLTPTSASIVSTTGNTNPCSVTVAVAPSTATIQARATQQFTATVANSTNTAVNWSVNNVAGGNATVGTVSATGLYTAPTVTSNLVVSVSAAWAADASRVGSAQVTVTPIPVTVDVAPSTATIQASTTQQFTATVSNSTNMAVNWSVNGLPGGDNSVGVVSATGLYTAPAVTAALVVTVSAVWSGDSTRSGSAQVTVNPVPVQPQAASGGGGGGGGAFGFVELAGLAAFTLLRRRRAPQS
ncbi:MAG: S8 family serine peptidase [Gammaproteobacteria bacterium]